jgi:predicted DNA-binding protein (MmcQ/YjbR family)
MARPTNMERLEALVSRLPQAIRLDIEAWDGEPTFRVNNKVFIFTNAEASSVTVKLSPDEAEAVVATDDDVTSTGYGLGRHGWVSVKLGSRPSAARWRELEEWVISSYCLVAPKTLAREVEASLIA